MNSADKDQLVESGQENSQDYSVLFTAYSDAVEKQIIRLAAVLAVILVVVQLALLIPSVRETLVRVERLEGVPFDTHRQNED